MVISKAAHLPNVEQPAESVSISSLFLVTTPLGLETQGLLRITPDGSVQA
jgi:hypothetical protein